MSTKLALALVAAAAVAAYFFLGRTGAGVVSDAVVPDKSPALLNASPAYNPVLGGYKFAQGAMAPPGLGGGGLNLVDAPVNTRAGAISSGLGGVGGKL